MLMPIEARSSLLAGYLSPMLNANVNANITPRSRLLLFDSVAAPEYTLDLEAVEFSLGTVYFDIPFDKAHGQGESGSSGRHQRTAAPTKVRPLVPL
jgi:hypothetical protein